MQICSRRSTDNVKRINFRFRFWSSGHIRMVVLHICTKVCANYGTPHKKTGFARVVRTSYFAPTWAIAPKIS